MLQERHHKLWIWDHDRRHQSVPEGKPPLTHVVLILKISVLIDFLRHLWLLLVRAQQTLLDQESSQE